MMKETQIESFWQTFLQTLPANAIMKAVEYDAWSFGHTPELADRLGGLVCARTKTGTSSLLWSYAADGELLPRIGCYSVILDGQGEPLCIIQTTALEIMPFRTVPASHAHAEGEGDRSLQYWQAVHWEVFSMECDKHGFTPAEDMPILVERFQLVFPLMD